MDTFTTPAPPPSTFASTIVLTSPPRSWLVISCSGRPSLLAYNDAVFTKDDFVSISRIGDSKKQGQVWKTGRFGVGFNSVYHLPFPMAAAAPAAHRSSKTESYVDAKHRADICQANILTARFIANVVRISLGPDAAHRKVWYFYDTEVGNYYDGHGHPMNPHRIRMTLALFPHYGLLDQMQVLKPHSIRDRDLCCFHAHEYINFLRSVTPETQQDQMWALKRFNVGEYCPVFDGLYTFCQTYAGGLVGSAVKLNHNHANIAVNWAGGLHHTKKCGASGFCYVNDVVLTVLELLKVHVRVLYVNIDIHHGDGVEEVF